MVEVTGDLRTVNYFCWVPQGSDKFDRIPIAHPDHWSYNLSGEELSERIKKGTPLRAVLPPFSSSNFEYDHNRLICCGIQSRPEITLSPSQVVFIPEYSQWKTEGSLFVPESNRDNPSLNLLSPPGSIIYLLPDSQFD